MRPGEYWGERCGIKAGGDTRWYYWCKCPECGGGKWSIEQNIRDHICKSVCRPCFGIKQAAKSRRQAAIRNELRVPYEKKVDNAGYILIWVTPDDPYFDSVGKARSKYGARMAEHRYVMSRHLGRKLNQWETVHHKNGKRADNRVENLELWAGSHRAGQRIADMIVHYLDEMTFDQFRHVVTKTRHYEVAAANTRRCVKAT